MENRERYLAAHIRNRFHMNLQFQMLTEIERYKKGEAGIWKEHEEKIAELAFGIMERKFTRYNMDEDFIKDKYEVKDELTAYLICALAFYKAGYDVIQSECTPTLTCLNEIEENMDTGFFMGYQLSKETLTNLIKSLEGRALEIASQSRDMEQQKDALRKFCESLDCEKNEDEIISKINLYSDGSYVEIANHVNLLAYMLAARELWEEYYQLLEIVCYFPLQGALIKNIRSARDVLSIIELADNHHGKKSLHYLLREQFYQLLCGEGGMLEGHLKEKYLTEDVKGYIRNMLDAFEEEKPSMIKTATDIWLRVFNKEEIVIWLSGKKSEAERKHERYRKPELEIVTMILDLFPLTSEDIKSFKLENMGFDTLLTLASQSDDENVCVSLINAIANNIFSNQSYPPTVLNEQWFNQQRIIYNCLNQSKSDGLDILQKAHKPLEGYKVDLGVSMRNVRQTSYWLAMLLLSLEDSKDEGKFKEYTERLFRDTRYSIESLTDDVFAPYYIAELIVSQVMQEQKDNFESEIIEKIPYLVFVIRVLTANQGKMSDKIKKLLVARINTDWEAERKLLSQNKMVQLQFYDDFVAKCETA